MEEIEKHRLSPRLRNALIADLLRDTDPAEGDRLILGSMCERDATDHLARQLGFRTPCSADLYDTLIMLLPEIDRLLRDWPLPKDGKSCEVLAEVATKSLTPIEIYGALLAGPAAWRRHVINRDCSIDRLNKQLLKILQRGLAASLNDVFGNWDSWDVRRLRDRWEEAKRRREASILEGERIDQAQAAQDRRRRLAESREERARWNRAASYTAPGRVT